MVLSRSEKRTIYSGEDLLMMEAFNNFEAINLLAIILDHMNKTVMVKDSKHGIGYGLLFTKVFTYFGVPIGVGVKGTVNKGFL